MDRSSSAASDPAAFGVHASACLIDGRPAHELPASDRGLAYGDGLFETIRYGQAGLLFADLHWQRLARGCERLDIALDSDRLEAECEFALGMSATEQGILKVIVTRGESGRGYRSPPSAAGRRIVSLHPLPDHSAHAPEHGIQAFVCEQRLALQPSLAGIKHLNRLEQVLASLEWPGEQFFEGLMLDHEDRLVEGTRSNLFMFRNGRPATPMLDRCGVHGIMREVLLQHYGSTAIIDDFTLDDLARSDEVFLCNSVFGIWPLLSLRHGQSTYSWQAGPAAREAAMLFAQASL